MLDLQSASLPEIAAHYESTESNWIRTNMITSVDGHFVGSSNTSRDLTGEADLNLLLLLRAISDVVLVGANTARSENYRQPKARDEFTFLNRKPPRLAVVSSSLKFDLSSPLFGNGKERTIVINAGDNVPSDELLKVADVFSVKNDRDFATTLISTLRNLNLAKVTCEGGPNLLAQLLRADAIDEYDLTISPIKVGGTSPWADSLPHPTNWDQVGGAKSGDFTFKRLLLRR
jgi:riboflavin biosynthesis pyrimidine reductase